MSLQRQFQAENPVRRHISDQPALLLDFRDTMLKNIWKNHILTDSPQRGTAILYDNFKLTTHIHVCI